MIGWKARWRQLEILVGEAKLQEHWTGCSRKNVGECNTRQVFTGNIFAQNQQLD